MSSRCLSYPVHITTSSSAQCRRKNDVAVIHQHMLALPRRSVFRVSDTSLVCTPEFAFVEIAGQGGSVVELLELGYEMCGTYRARLSCEPKGRTPVLPERVATAVIPDGGGRSPARAVDVVSTGGLRAEVAAPPASPPSSNTMRCLLPRFHLFAISQRRIRLCVEVIASGEFFPI